MRAVTDETFEAQVLRSQRPVVVDFGAPWCAPCKAIEPALARLAGELTAIEFVQLDVDANPVAASRYDVLSLPTVCVFRNGELVESIVGARSYDHYAGVVRSVAGPGAGEVLEAAQ